MSICRLIVEDWLLWQASRNSLACLDFACPKILVLEMSNDCPCSSAWFAGIDLGNLKPTSTNVRFWTYRTSAYVPNSDSKARVTDRYLGHPWFTPFKFPGRSGHAKLRKDDSNRQ